MDLARKMQSLVDQIIDELDAYKVHTSAKTELEQKQRTRSSNPPNTADIKIEDRVAVLELAAYEQELKIYPVQIADRHRLCGISLRHAAMLTEELKDAIRELAVGEQKELVAKIARVNAPFSVRTQTRYCNETILQEWAAEVGWSSPIVLSIGQSVACASKPIDEGTYPREQYPEMFDTGTLEHVNEVVAIAQKFLQNNCSFVPAGVFAGK